MDFFQTADTANIAFHYDEGERPTHVLLHGAYLASNEWQPQMNALQGKSNLRIDLRGHGQSDKKGYPYSVGKFADDVKQLIEHLSLADVVVCGHSLGGMVAQSFAIRYPKYVSKLVLADTSYGVRSTWLETLFTNLTLPLFNLAPVAWQASFFADQIGKFSADARQYVETEIVKHAENPENYREIWKAVTQFSGYEHLKDIECPTLILVGSLNKQTHKQARMMEEQISNSSLVFIEKAGHMLNWDNPQQFNSALEQFV